MELFHRPLDWIVIIEKVQEELKTINGVAACFIPHMVVTVFKMMRNSLEDVFDVVDVSRFYSWNSLIRCLSCFDQ